jgi:hypothetical protein
MATLCTNSAESPTETQLMYGILDQDSAGEGAAGP